MLVNLACWAMIAVGATDLPQVEGKLTPDRPTTVDVAALPTARNLSVLICLKRPSHLPFGVPIKASVSFGETTLTKTLHLGDPDVLWSIRQPANTPARIALDSGKGLKEPAPYAVRVAEVGESADDGVAFETEPNDRPENANRLVLGQTVYGLADDRPYLPLGEHPTEAERAAGIDWFTFEFTSDTPKLAFFGLDFVDRDVPPDVRVFHKKDGKVVEYTQGIDPQSLQRERPPRPGANKFSTRVLTKGTYYVLVDACQPEYQLRTKLFDVPPYLKKDDGPEAVAAAARKAVRVAMDFQLLAGDSWHANTPRKGHPLDRVANPHHETSTCIACHPTHFTTQSALTAVRNGYKVEQPFALEFLTDRLANNPVPFHGHPDALWARMIPAPANVMGRLSTILMDYENLVDTNNVPRDVTHEGIAEFLKLYYDGRTALPPDESNGNNPVSRYKVATDSWRQLDELFRRTGHAPYAETRDLIARLLPTGEPANTRDLAAQTIGLCLMGKEKYAAKVEANVKRLLELQRPNGHWSVKFDPKYAQTEMQTGESLYALALAGLPADHPAIHKGVVALLLNQKRFGGWLDINPYEQFQTPFRETQWALMSLSRLYPGPGTKGWNDPLGAAPDRPRVDSASHRIADFDRIWGGAKSISRGEEFDQINRLAQSLHHELPLVRYAACRTLAREGYYISHEVLGDESKVVRRAAAFGHRAYANRINRVGGPRQNFDQLEYEEALARDLTDDDDLRRRGATRIFAAHFRDLSQELDLADTLLKRLDDSDPVVQMQAVKGLWRWWYWRDDLGLRNRIEDALIAKLAAPTHPWVRRNLIEALYIIGDENIRYLYGNWIPALASRQARERATVAQHATVNRLGDKYVAVLEKGNPLQREGVLRAISEFPDRPGRIGNDLEPMLFYDDALPRVSSALIRATADPDPTLRRLALQALISLRGYRDPALARAVAARQGDSNAEVREAAGAAAKDFPLTLKPGQADPALVGLIGDLLTSATPQAEAAALDLIARIGPTADSDQFAEVRSRLGAASPLVRASAFRALAAFPASWQDEGVRRNIRQALADPDPDTRVAAVRLALEPRTQVPERDLRKALEDDAPAHRIALLGAIGGSKTYANDLRLIGVVSDALDDANQGVREKALQVIQTHPSLVSNPAIENSLRELSRSENQRQKEIAAALLKSRGRSSGGGAAEEVLDLAYFTAKVLPVFNAMGEDGQNCVGCHRSHTILKMAPPGPEGQWSPQAARANFRAALRVVNLPKPADSLLVNKPTWEAAEEAEAQNDPTKHAHAGGVRFTKGSPEYQALLDWINGARLKPKGETP